MKSSFKIWNFKKKQGSATGNAYECLTFYDFKKLLTLGGYRSAKGRDVVSGS